MATQVGTVPLRSSIVEIAIDSAEWADGDQDRPKNQRIESRSFPVK